MNKANPKGRKIGQIVFEPSEQNAAWFREIKNPKLPNHVVMNYLLDRIRELKDETFYDGLEALLSKNELAKIEHEEAKLAAKKIELLRGFKQNKQTVLPGVR